MKKDNVEKAVKISGEIDRLKHDLWLWEEGKGFDKIELSNINKRTGPNLYMPELLDFEKIKNDAIREIKKRIAELDKEFESL